MKSANYPMRSDLSNRNETLIRGSYPSFEIAHASTIEAHLRELIAVPETGDLFFSIFLDLSTPRVEADLRHLVGSLTPGLEEETRYWLFQAESCLLDVLGTRVRGAHKGLVVHFRGGKSPLVRAIVFHLPVRTWACVDRAPNLVPLIEMRDQYDRYVVLISDRTHARILEVVVGSVTREAWLSRPELRKQLEQKWSMEHYRNYELRREDRFLREKIDILEDLMRKGKYAHLILAGEPERLARIEAALPAWIRDRIVDVCNLGVADPRERIVGETICSFVEQEAFESRSALERLEQLILHGAGNSAVGLDACECALSRGVVETLLVSRLMDPEDGSVRVFRHRTPDGNFLTIEKRRQGLMNRAVAEGIRIEFVDRDSFLNDYCGVGAILRFGGMEFARES